MEQVKRGFSWASGPQGDRHLPSLARAAQAIKDEGAVALLQIHDAGRMSDPRVIDWTPRSASDIPAERPNALQPRPMSQDEIMGSVAAFAAAARRAVQAGFDGVEIHGANTYLLQQFFSPHSNRREDDWGGDLQRRMRFPLAVARAVRRAVGDNVVVGYRFSPARSGKNRHHHRGHLRPRRCAMRTQSRLPAPVLARLQPRLAAR
ncbi:MAG: hypothetical protein R2856_23405 [Caldilineaceae bacterium]